MGLTVPPRFLTKGRTLEIFARGYITGNGNPPNSSLDIFNMIFEYGTGFRLYMPHLTNTINISQTSPREWETNLVLTCLDVTNPNACTFGGRAANDFYGRYTLGNNAINTSANVIAYGWRHHSSANTLDIVDNTIPNTIDLKGYLNYSTSSVVSSLLVYDQFIMKVIN